MTSKRDLSNKKTASQNISISPSLKELIEGFVRKMHEENKGDERYKSVSAFYCNVMENVLKIFEKGKTLDDFDRLQDKKTKSFFDKYSANVFVPIVEPMLRESRYSSDDFNKNARFYLAARDILLGDLEPYDYEGLMKSFERLKRRYLYSGLSRDISLDLFIDKNKKNFKGVLEHSGLWKNFHILNCKNLAESLGIDGFKITRFLTGNKGLYYRMDLEITDLAFNKDLVLKERIRLLEHNLSFIINYYNILNDRDFYLWTKMADDYNNIITFKNQTDFDKWINKIEKDLQKFGNKDAFLTTLLKFFEKIHWINMENEKELKFQFNIPEEKYKEERQFFTEYISKYAKILNDSGYFYLEIK